MSQTIIRPLGDRVLVQPIVETTTAGGLILTQASPDRPQFGRVVAVGPGRTLLGGVVGPMELEVGHKVVFPKNAGTITKHEGAIYRIISEADILAVIGED